jgi:hypothetical protein
MQKIPSIAGEADKNHHRCSGAALDQKHEPNPGSG